MRHILKAFACRTIAVAAALASAFVMNSLAVPNACAGDAMPVAQQNALVQEYCAVCHTDAARSGGLSLERFDAAQTAPSLAAMMISKLTSGVSLETVRAAASDPNAAALVARKMKSGAMGAAGVPIPDKATIDALINALAVKAAGAKEWDANHTQDPATKGPMLTASMLREVPSARNAGEAAMYRLVLTCNTATHEGEVQLAWAPAPKTGTLAVLVDGKTPVTYDLEGAAAMSAAGAAISLSQSKSDSQSQGILLPAKSLRITHLSPDESVEFQFADLPQTARQSLAACFQGGIDQ